MKKIELISVCAALLMASAIVNAEDQYPASDFQPKVVYQDEGSAGGSSSSSASPSSSDSSSSSSSSSGDGDYPAANFQPKVVFEDKEYKHSESISSGSSSGSLSSSSDSSASSGSAPAAKDESSVGYLLGLLVLGIVGFVLFKKGVISAGQGGSGSAKSAAGGLTGVAKYLLKTSGTGVSRYLEKQVGNAPAGKTGVARYLASKGPSADTGASAGRSATGVERYMRNKG